jgi:hypothetical protein
MSFGRCRGQTGGIGCPAIQPLEGVVEPLLAADEAGPNVGEIVNGFAANVDAARPHGPRRNPAASGAMGPQPVLFHGARMWPAMLASG